MPFISGALSLRRYQIMGEVSPTLDRTATLAIRRYTWKPIDDSRGEKESFGWVNPRRLLDDQFSWEDLMVSPFVLLGVRRDRKTFSPVLFRARRDRLFGETRREKKVEKLSRQQRLALEEELTIKMLKETSPASSFAELLWDLNSGIVFMGSTSNPLCERIQEVFEATFDLKLRPLYPALTGAQYIALNGLEDEFHIGKSAGAR